MKGCRIRRWSVVLSIVLVACVAQASGAEEVDPGRIVGTWKLLSLETLLADGNVIYDFMGRNPTGQITYNTTGQMSVQIMHDPRPMWGPGSRLTSAEIETAFYGYYAYFGPYDVDEEAGTVIHHVQASLWPTEVGVAYTQEFTISGDRLVLLAAPYLKDGEERRSRYTWQRIE
jgi:hypothetical protein